MSNTLLHYKLAKKPVDSFAAAERAQAEMLDLLRRSPIDPLAYVGLTQCGPNQCGRVGCSEVCWFGYLRRKLREEEEFRRLIADGRGALCSAYISKTGWSQNDPDLQQLDPVVGARLVRRLLNGLQAGRPVVARGSFKVEPRGTSSYWKWDVELLVAGPEPFYLSTGIAKNKGWTTDVHVKEVKNLEKTLDEVLDCNVAALVTKHMFPRRTEFYKWLVRIKTGSRFIRYGYEDR
jgi:hypothetical protein